MPVALKHIDKTDVEDFIQKLEDEIAVQNVSSGNVMGVLA